MLILIDNDIKVIVEKEKKTNGTISKDFPFEGWRIQIYLVLNGRLVRYILKGFQIVRILKTYNCPIGSKRKITINRKL